MQYSATWRIMARRAVCPLAFAWTPSVSLSMLIFSFHWAHRDRQWRVHGCFIKFVGLGRLAKITNTQKDVLEWEYFTRGIWVCRSAYIHYWSEKRLSDVHNYADFDWRFFCTKEMLTFLNSHADSIGIPEEFLFFPLFVASGSWEP